jgi:hypothetical protein
MSKTNPKKGSPSTICENLGDSWINPVVYLYQKVGSCDHEFSFIFGKITLENS